VSWRPSGRSSYYLVVNGCVITSFTHISITGQGVEFFLNSKKSWDLRECVSVTRSKVCLIESIVLDLRWGSVSRSLLPSSISGVGNPELKIKLVHSKHDYFMLL